MVVNKHQMRLTSCSSSILMKSTPPPWSEVLVAQITRSSFIRSPVTGQEGLGSACWNVCHFTTPGMLQGKAVWHQISASLAPLVFRRHLFVSTGGSREEEGCICSATLWGGKMPSPSAVPKSKRTSPEYHYWISHGPFINNPMKCKLLFPVY